VERGSSASGTNFAKYERQLSVDSIHGETQDSIADADDVVITFGVVFALLLVDLSIDFDDKFRPRAAEIDDTRADRMLSAKLPAVKTMIPQHLPEYSLAGRRTATEIA